jgi:hypothetical protein
MALHTSVFVLGSKSWISDYSSIHNIDIVYWILSKSHRCLGTGKRPQIHGHDLTNEEPEGVLKSEDTSLCFVRFQE